MSLPIVNGRILTAVAVVAAVVPLAVYAHNHGPILQRSIFETDLLGSDLVKQLSSIKQAIESDQPSSFQQWAFAKLFPFNARWNSVLATFYISSFPNLILAFVPTELNPQTLNQMITFATGGLLGDVCLHLIPHSFMGESGSGAGASVNGVRVVLVEEKRNILIGAAIFGGFFAFYLLDKTMRVLNASEEEGSHGGHSHGHHHHHHAKKQDGPSSSISTALETSDKQDQLRHRKKDGQEVDEAADTPDAQLKPTEANSSLRLSAYLNLFGDFTHNITDGLAMAASFYASPQLGATSAFATFCHEIPHEIADYSILVKSGFSKREAMTSQFITAIGAFVGTFLGIWIAESSGAGESVMEKGVDLAAIVSGQGTGYLGTSVKGSDLVIPATAGGFLYIASVSVIPELLAESRSGKQTLKEYGWMLFGFGVMGVLAWTE